MKSTEQFTLNDWKAAAYDTLVQIENLQKQMADINQKIASQVVNEPKATDTEEKKKAG